MRFIQVEDPITAEQVTEEFSKSLQTDYGFDPLIIVSIIAAIIQLIANKSQRGQNATSLQECCKRRSILTLAQLRRELAYQGVPARDRARASNAAMEIGAAATAEKFAAFCSCC